jgi:hypothetical protein
VLTAGLEPTATPVPISVLPRKTFVCVWLLEDMFKTAKTKILFDVEDGVMEADMPLMSENDDDEVLAVAVTLVSTTCKTFPALIPVKFAPLIAGNVPVNFVASNVVYADVPNLVNAIIYPIL